MSQRTLDTILALLELYPDVNHPATAADRVRVSDSFTSPSLMMDPRWHQGTFRELEEALKFMRSNGRQKAYRGEPVGVLYWHVDRWWLSPERVRRWARVRRPNEKGELRTVWDWTVLPARHPDARERKARWGAEWLDAQWPVLVELARREGRPFRSVPQLPPAKCSACGKGFDYCRCAVVTAAA